MTRSELANIEGVPFKAAWLFDGMLRAPAGGHLLMMSPDLDGRIVIEDVDRAEYHAFEPGEILAVEYGEFRA